MPTLNFRINRIKGTRKDTDANNVNVRSNFTIISIKKDKDPRIGEYLHVNFKFDIRYEPDLGNIDLEGSLWYQHPELKKIISENEGKIKLKAEAVRDISNSILQRSIINSIDIVEKLRLPLPIQLPKVNVKSKEVMFPRAS